MSGDKLSSFKLCGKDYAFKMSIGAMRQFKKASDRDMWHILVQTLETYMMNADKPLLTTLEQISSKISYFDAALLLHALAQQENKNIGLDEIEDGMFRVGFMPVMQDDSEMIECWPLVLVSVAQEVEKTLSEVVSVKKKQLTGSDTPNQNQ